MIITVDYKNKLLESHKSNAFGDLKLDKTNAFYEQYVEGTKIIIDWGQDVENGFRLEFNNDYTILRKKRI